MIGILPAGGLASRLAPLRYPKELLPVAIDDDGVPRPVIACSLAQLARAGVTECCVVVSEQKLELVRVLGERHAGVVLAYVVRSVPRGLADAVDAPYAWIGERAACVALPDTILEPADALAQVRQELERSGADLVLGVFPTDSPREFGPVRIASDGRVVEVQDKPAETDLANTWALAAWQPTFGALVHAAVAADVGANLGLCYQRAVERGLHVRAVTFDAGRFLDTGTPAGLRAALLR